jgi:hypothetical protein
LTKQRLWLRPCTGPAAMRSGALPMPTRGRGLCSAALAPPPAYASLLLRNATWLLLAM